MFDMQKSCTPFFLFDIARKKSWHGVRYDRERWQMRYSLHVIVTGNSRIVQVFFVLTCLVGVWLPIAAAGQTVEARSAPHRLIIGMLELRTSLTDSSAKSSNNGLTLGIEEARRTGRLFGWEIVVVVPPDSLPIIEAHRYLIAAVPTAIVGDLTRSSVPALSGASAPLYLDVGNAPKRARSDCGDRTVRLLPSSRPTQTAAKGDSEITTKSSDLVAWHPALERFGAAQLNERYRKRFGSDMDERAWAGWLSIKVLLDAALRTGTSDRCALERFLLSAAGRFDGHKGVPLFFDPQTRELVQPLYAPRASGEPEVVSMSPSNEPTSRGAGAAGRSCAPSCG